jgi:hypothetical protein
MITPPKETPGATHGQRRFNNLLRFAKSLRVIAGPGVRVSHTVNGTVVEATATSKGGSKALWG